SYSHVGATLDVSLDELGRPRRLAETFTGSSVFGPTTLSTVVTFVGYGRPVEVVAPLHARILHGGAAARAPSALGDTGRLFERLLFSRGHNDD
ncbi:MAG TPA: hypothetical protein VH025_00955, partial [Solirubrobacteraceae bacterium]|nr:hypothetical protein [Solirubrobacteraceae bacterium]